MKDASKQDNDMAFTCYIMTRSWRPNQN